MRNPCLLALLVITLSLCGCFQSELETIPRQTGRRIEDMPDGIYRNATDPRSYYRFKWSETAREYEVWGATAKNPEPTEAQQIRTVPIGESKRYGRVYLIQREDEKGERRIFRYEIATFDKRNGRIQTINFDGEAATKRLETVAKTARIPLEWSDDIWTHILRTNNHLDQKWFFQLLASKLDEFGDEILVTEYVRDGSASPIAQHAGTAAQIGAAARSGSAANDGLASPTLSATVRLEHPVNRRLIRFSAPVGWRKEETRDGNGYLQVVLRSPESPLATLSAQHLPHGYLVYLKGPLALRYSSTDEFIQKRHNAYSKQTITGRLTDPEPVAIEGTQWICFDADLVDPTHFESAHEFQNVLPDALWKTRKSSVPPYDERFELDTQALGLINNVRHSYGVLKVDSGTLVFLYTAPINKFDTHLFPMVLKSVRGNGSFSTPSPHAAYRVVFVDGTPVRSRSQTDPDHYDVAQGTHSVTIKVPGYEVLSFPDLHLGLWKTISLQGGWVTKAYHEAASDFDQIISENPTDAHLHFHRGRIAYDAGNYDKALADFDTALAINPNGTYFLAYKILATGYIALSLRDYDAAFAAFDKLLQIEPSNYLALLGRAKARHGQRAFALALADANKSIERWPGPEGYAARSMIRRDAGDVTGADEDAIKSDQKHQEREARKAKDAKPKIVYQ